MNVKQKIKWLIFLLSHDGLPEGTLDLDTSDPLTTYAVLLMIKRISILLHRPVDISLVFALRVCITRATTEFNYTEDDLHAYYDEYLFDWEKSDINICGMYF